MRPGMQCLLELLRGQSLDRVVDDAEWGAALALAEDEHVLAWAADRLRSREGVISPRILRRLETIERDAAIAAFYWCSELKGVLRAFDRSSLRVVLLKGPSLAERLYGSVALRASRDLDLLVSKTDLTRAESVLTAMGFVPDAYPDDYHRAWHRETTTVELHHDVENPLAFNFDVESALRQAQKAVFQGQPCWLLAPEDELLFLCLHAARHRFERLSLVLDLQLAFEKLTGDANEAQRRPEVAGLNGLLALGLAMARRLQPDVAVVLQSPVSKRQALHLERLADRLWDRLLTQVCEPLDWRAVHAFYLEIELPGWHRLHRRYRHLQILLGRVIGPDYAFAARFGLHQAWQVRLLRPLRLLSGMMWR
jgi:hypothetical protein